MPFASSIISGGSACAFASDLERFGDAPAIITDRGEVVSYRALAARADAWAAQLALATLVAVEAANEIDPLCAYLGPCAPAAP